MQYNLAVIGAGPGGYTAAARAASLGLKTVVIESARPGGICLNHGCIPTKTLLRTSEVLLDSRKADNFGLQHDGEPRVDLGALIKRVNSVGDTLCRGIEFLFKQTGVEYISGHGELTAPHTIEITTTEGKQVVTADNIIIATGSSPRSLKGFEPDGAIVWTYREALRPDRIPENMLIIGSGAIGSELAWFYNSIGTRVHICEVADRLIPAEDKDMSAQLERSFKKAGIKVYTGASLTRTAPGKVSVAASGKSIELDVDTILSAVGIVPNITGIGLEKAGIETDGRFIKVDSNYQTSVPNHYAIGDIIATPALAHVAEAEAKVCADIIAGLNPSPVDYGRIPACIYAEPEIASVGLNQARAGEDIVIGTCSMAAVGKAVASGKRDGMVKLVFRKSTMELLGAQLCGPHVTEMIYGLGLAIGMKATAMDIADTVFPHPTVSEAIRIAAENALSSVI